MALAVCLTAALAGCSAAGRPPESPPALPTGAEAVSLFGQPLFPPALAPDVRAEREARLAEARAAVAARPRDADALIWLGRRTAYLGRYREAVEIFTRGAALHPDDPRFLRHRGHRWITLRRFDLAEADLEKAAAMIRGKTDEVEPDGLPNARNIPTSTLQSNIWYHLGLARYLMGDSAGALTAYRECLAVSKNPDMLVATTYWLYLTLRRLGHSAESDEAREALAPIKPRMDILENGAYHQLLLLYRGEIGLEMFSPPVQGGDLDPVSLGYGVAAWLFHLGMRDDAVRALRDVVAQGTGPPSGTSPPKPTSVAWGSAHETPGKLSPPFNVELYGRRPDGILRRSARSVSGGAVHRRPGCKHPSLNVEREEWPKKNCA